MPKKKKYKGQLLAESRAADQFLGFPIAVLSGVTVNEATALNCTAVYAAVDCIATTVATLPMEVFRRLDDGGQVPDRLHPNYDLVHCAPNDDMSAVRFIQAIMSHSNTFGNGYAEIERDSWSGAPTAIYLLDPRRTQSKVSKSGRRYYELEAAQDNRIVQPENMIHIAGLGYDGVVGYSPVRVAREAIGLSLATEKYGAAFFGNSAQPNGFLEVPGKMQQIAKDHLRNSFNNEHQGVNNAHRIGILEQGVKWVATSFSPEDAQFLLTRQFQLSEIARMWRVPPHKIGDLSHATFSNIEEQNIDFYISCIRPWVVTLEAEFNRKLFTSLDRATHHIRLDMRALLRGNETARTDNATKLFMSGVLSPNEMRSEFGLNPIGLAGDLRFRPQNLAVLEVREEMAPVVGDAVEGGAAVADTALNGAQIASLLSVITSVTSGLMPTSTAKGLIAASFPTLDDAEVEAILGPLEGFRPTITALDKPSEPLQEEPTAADGPTTDPAAEAARAAVRAVLVDAVSRVIRREEKALSRAAKKADLKERLTAYHDFFEGELALVAEALGPAVRAFATVTGQRLDHQAVADQLVKESSSAVLSSVEGDTSLGTILDGWHDRAEGFVDSLSLEAR